MLMLKKMPETLFMQLLTKKGNMLKKHLKDTHSNLVMHANVGPNIATFKLYNTKEEDSLKLHVTITNLGDIGKQLYQLWIQLNYLLREYCPHCQPVSTYIKKHL